jgi:hypothetical protein
LSFVVGLDAGFAVAPLRCALSFGALLGDLFFELIVSELAECARLVGEVLVDALAGERGFVVNPRSLDATPARAGAKSDRLLLRLP